MTIWNLKDVNEKGITLDKQFFFDHDTTDMSKFDINVVINKDQILLALSLSPGIINIFSIKTGIWISRYGWYYFCK